MIRTRRTTALAIILSMLALGGLAGCAEEDDATPHADADAFDTGVDVTGGDTGGVDARDDIAAEVGPDAGTDDAPIDGAGPADEEVPRLRDVRVALDEPFETELDLNAGDRLIRLPADQTGTFVVFASDNESLAEDLVVEVLEDEGAPIDGQSALLDGGLWRVSTPIPVGSTLRVRVTDAAGNAVTSEFALLVPTRAESIVGAWEKRRYDEEQAVVDRTQGSWTEEGTWQREELGDAGTSEGTFEVDGSLLTVTQTEFAEDPDAAAIRRVGRFYIDDVYFSERPYITEERTDGIAATWVRDWRLTDVSADGAEAVGSGREVVETLELGEDGQWTWQRVVTPDDGGDAEQTTMAGSWEVVANDNYVENFGDFLARTITERDGETLSEPETLFQLHRPRGDWLLVSPKVRVDE